MEGLFCFLKIQGTHLHLVEGNNKSYSPLLYHIHFIYKICHVNKYTCGTYKNKVIHTLTLCLAGATCGKLFPLWITIMTKKLDFDKMSGELCMGDNPFGGI
jgi:hypothetical protein